MQRHRQRALLNALYELFSSMRFAIVLLTILAIASVIGTVIKQNEPYPNYAFEFGAFWFQVFANLGLYDVYHAGWFIALLALLFLSTLLCIVRHVSKLLRNRRADCTKLSEDTLMAMRYTASIEGQVNAVMLTQYLRRHGYRYKATAREDSSTLYAANKGRIHRLGYFCVHGAFVMICLGGLFDSNLPLKMDEWLGRALPETRVLPEASIPTKSRRPADTLAFRGDVMIPENKSADVVFINRGAGYLIQELPFYLTLRQFKVEYYRNGTPKLFASDLDITDKVSGKVTRGQVQVNRPLTVDGVTIYQANYGDGGSPLRFKVWYLNHPQSAPIELDGVSKASQTLFANQRQFRLEIGELHVVNVEDEDKEKSAISSRFSQRIENARTIMRQQTLINLGPSIEYTIRDDTGQARAYLSYITPIKQDGAYYLMSATRGDSFAPYHLLRIPLDDHLSIARFMRLRAVLSNPTLYEQIAEQSSGHAIKNEAIDSATQKQFKANMKWALARFATEGFNGLQTFLTQHVPTDKRANVAQIYIKILLRAADEGMKIADRHASTPSRAQDATHYRFLLDSLVAMSDLKAYGSPVFLQFIHFKYIQASGLQLTRSPGKPLVYLGCALLVVGLILMFYVHEKQLWILVKPTGLRLSMSAKRHTPWLNQDFARHRDAIKQLARGRDETTSTR